MRAALAIIILSLTLLKTILLSPAALAQDANDCYKPDPNWDTVLKTKAQVDRADLLRQESKAVLLKEFAGLEDMMRQIRNGTLPYCKRHADHNRDVAAYDRDVAQFNSQCASVRTQSQLSACQSRRGPLLSRKQQLDAIKAALDKEAQSLNDQQDASWKHFIDAANEALTQLPAAAGTLVVALNRAAALVNPNKAVSVDREKICSAFFRAVGKQVGANTPEWVKDLSANAIAERISTDTSGNWRALKGTGMDLTKQAQQLAEHGHLVVGVARAKPHGHIAIVSPVPPGLHLDDFGSAGPMVRDGNMYQNSEGKVFPKDWGTVRASKAFDYGANPPTWYVWR